MPSSSTRKSGSGSCLEAALSVFAAAVICLVPTLFGLPAYAAEEVAEPVDGASSPPPGVVVDDEAALPIAPDPESLYIRLLTADLPAAAVQPVSAVDTKAAAGATSEPAEGSAREVADRGAAQRPGKDQKKELNKDLEKDTDKKSARSSCGDAAKECQEALQRLRDDAISDIGLDIRVGGRPGSDYPCECRLEGETFQPRRFATTMMTWKAAGYCHKPLYFEDWSLERYGHSHGPLADPFFSAAHFFVTLPVLPYKMGVELPWECVYPLGYYRPGSCAPWTIPAVPISCRGFAVQAATVTGIVFALP